MAPTPDPPAEVNQKRVQAVLVWAVGAFCIYVWDSILCLPQEYQRIWNKKSTPITVLYFVNRYFGLMQFSVIVSIMAGAWSPAACKYMFHWNPVGFLISTVLSQMILGVRVYAIYSQSRAVAVVLSAILLVEVCLGGITVSLTSQPPDGSCIAAPAPRGWMIEYCLLPLFYDTVSFGLTAWKTYDFWRKEVNTPLMSVIWRDGILYFFAICTMNLINVLIFLIAPNSLTWVVNLTPTLIFTVLLSCRLVLNLRKPHGNQEFMDRSTEPTRSGNRNLNRLTQDRVMSNPITSSKPEWIDLSVPSESSVKVESLVP